jgi:hypothetical protein
MRVPEFVVDRLPALEILEEDWEPISQIALLGWALFFGIVWVGAVAGGGVARWFDLVFVPIHEGGHLLFGWFGSHWLMVAGGTLLQLFVPFALAVYFALRRQIPGTAFCGFFFFEQLLPVGTYMADSRSQSLTYVTVGDPDQAEHDWYYLFSHAGVLDHDTQIGGAVRILGFIGMFAVVAWLIWRAWRMRSVHPTGMPPIPATTVSVFGDLGSNLETARKSGFWQWFHLEQTGGQNGVNRFQPTGPQFHPLCYLDVSVSAMRDITALTLGVQRAFIEGADQPFARDLLRSFLGAVFREQQSPAVSQLVEELGSEFGGSRPVIVAEGVHRPAPVGKPSALYSVFLGQGKRSATRSGTFTLEVENVTDESKPWLCVRVKP